MKWNNSRSQAGDFEQFIPAVFLLTVLEDIPPLF